MSASPKSPAWKAAFPSSLFLLATGAFLSGHSPSVGVRRSPRDSVSGCSSRKRILQMDIRIWDTEVWGGKAAF